MLVMINPFPLKDYIDFDKSYTSYARFHQIPGTSECRK